MNPTATDTTLVWRVEAADWPAGDLLGDDPAKLAPLFEPAALSPAERNIRESLREMGGIGDGILCYGGLRGFSPGERVDIFEVHEAMVEHIRAEGDAFGEMVDVLAEGQGDGGFQ